MNKDNEFERWYLDKIFFYKNFSLGVKVSVPIIGGLVFWLCYGYFVMENFNVWLLVIIIVLFISTIGRCLFMCLSPFRPKEPRLKK